MRVSAGSSSRYAAILSSGEQRTVVYAITTRIQIKKTEYDIFFRIVKEQPTHSTRNDAQANSGEVRLRIAPGVLTPPLAKESGGGERDRTDDPLLAKQVLSQLSYTPVRTAHPPCPPAPW